MRDEPERGERGTKDTRGLHFQQLKVMCTTTTFGYCENNHRPNNCECVQLVALGRGLGSLSCEATARRDEEVSCRSQGTKSK